MTRTLLAVVWKLNGEEGMVAVSEGAVLNEGERMNERTFRPKIDSYIQGPSFLAVVA